MTLNRQRNAELYRQMLPADRVVSPTVTDANTRHVYNQFVIRSPRRDGLREHLAAHGVATEIYYPIPLHLQKCFGYLGYQEGDFPHSELAAKESLALPVHTELAPSDIERVSELICGF